MRMAWRLVAGVLAVMCVVVCGAPSVDAATVAKPKIESFTHSTIRLSYLGGPVTLTGTVSNATSCTFGGVARLGLPLTVPCADGPVSITLLLPANYGKKTVKYEFTFSTAGDHVTKRSATIVLPDPN